MTTGTPLAGVRVLDFTRVLAGPICTRMLADLGAEVIKVEPPEGDVVRYQAPRRNGLPTYFVQQNTGKRCISVDLTQTAGRDLILELATHCDVVVENFRPGVLDRLGIGYQALAARRPDIVVVSISGYGQTGPWAQRMAYASVIGAEAGLTKSQGDQRDGTYVNDRVSHADVYTGMAAATSVLAALRQRDRDGVGQHVDVSMAATMLFTNEHAHDALWDGPDDPDAVRSFGNEGHPVVRAADGSHAVLAGNPAQKGTFELFAAAIGHPDLGADPRFAGVAARKAHFAELIGTIVAFAATLPDAEAVIEHFGRHRIAAGRLRSTLELAESEWAVASGAIAEVDDRGGGTFRIPQSPWRFSEAPAVGVHSAPRYRGEDNAGVLGDVLGYGPDAVADLYAQGVLSDHIPARRAADERDRVARP